MNSFSTLHNFLEVGKTQDLPSKFWQTHGVNKRIQILFYWVVRLRAINLRDSGAVLIRPARAQNICVGYRVLTPDDECT
jgi:hypothetical protein